MTAAVAIGGLWHRYGERVAIQDLTLDVSVGGVVGFLGPNGSGKSTLFRLLSTLVPVQEGTIRILDRDVGDKMDEVRGLLGVVFQAPSLDRKLTAYENIAFQGDLLGLRRRELSSRVEELSTWFRIREHLSERTEKLSGGLKRRVELVKGLLHEPDVLLLDEPSTGLDPVSRLELWQCLEKLRVERGTTVLLTTHLLDEAEKCDRIAIMDQGRLVAWDSPQVLRGETGECVLELEGEDLESIGNWIFDELGERGVVVGNRLRYLVRECDDRFWSLQQALVLRCRSVRIGRPGLEDVFFAKTGKAYTAV